jgi:hypothetical protein
MTSLEAAEIRAMIRDRHVHAMAAPHLGSDAVTEWEEALTGQLGTPPTASVFDEKE